MSDIIVTVKPTKTKVVSLKAVSLGSQGAADAAVSAAAAVVSATEADSAASSATTSATTATEQATLASTYATESATSANEAADSATSAAASATNATTQASAAATSSTNASTSETNAAASASTATTQATIATTKATTATEQATIATTKAAEALASASIISIPLPVSSGGTYATTAAGARTNLGAAASGANSDITSLTGLTTALSVTYGGTGASLAANARTNLGAAASGANSDITSLTGLTTALSITQGGTGANTAVLARIALGIPTTAAMFKNIVSTVTSNTAATIAADYCPYTQASFSQAIDFTTTGANALDTGTVAASKQYYGFRIYNPSTATAACLASLSATSPTLPSGYTQYVRICSNLITNSSGYLHRIIQHGNIARYIVSSSITTALPTLLSGTTGSLSTPTWTAVSVSSVVPTTATAIDIVVGQTSNFMVAPNNLYGAQTSTTNPPPISYNNFNSAYYFSFPFTVVLESTNIYAASASSGTFLIQCAGWRDNV